MSSKDDCFIDVDGYPMDFYNFGTISLVFSHCQDVMSVMLNTAIKGMHYVKLLDLYCSIK